MRGGESLLAALALMGCNAEPRYPEQCGARLEGWRQPSDGYGVLALTNRVSVPSDGTIKWNGASITRAQLAEFSAMIPSMNPVPFTILDIEADAPCKVVRETRQIIDEKAKCRATAEYSACGEGPDPWAQVGDVVGPNGELPEPFYPEPIVPPVANEAR